LLEEPFEDTDFEARGWYDLPAAALTTEAAPGSAHAFECLVGVGEGTCLGGRPSRIKFASSDTVYLGFWVRFSDNWQDDIEIFTLLTNVEDDYKGPGYTRLTASVVAGSPGATLRLTDGENVDTACVLLTDGSFVGCNGDFDSYVFTENRSVAACNGLIGDLDAHECNSQSGTEYWSARYWSGEAFVAEAGPMYKGDWHFVEAYFAMNGFVDGKGVPDGKIRFLVDGEPIVCSDQVLFRTGVHMQMLFNQLIGLMFMGPAPNTQTLWVDDLVVATARP
jgi:hypothetical protein